MKVKEVKPTVMQRRKVVIPHYASGGLFAGVPHYDGGGAVHPINVTGGMIAGAPSASQTSTDQQNVLDPTKSLPALLNPAQSIGNTGAYAGDIAKGLASDFTVQNQYQAQLAPTSSTDYSGIIGNAASNSLAGYNGFQKNQDQQQGLFGNLQSVANGNGPNPAQNMLNQATGANVANQAALMASQRGAGANAGLLARQAAMAGSGTQQQAAGQAATLQSQQQLNALNAQSGVLGQMGNQNIAEQGANNSLFGAATGAQNTQDANTISNYGNAQGLNQKTAQNNADATNKTLGGLTNGIGAIAALFAHGGQVPSHFQHMHALYHADNPKLATVPEKYRFANGGAVPNPTSTATNTGTSTATSTALSVDQRKTKAQKLNDIMDPNSTASVGYADGGDVLAPDFKGVQRRIGNWATEGQTDLQMKAAKSVAQNGGESQMLPPDMKSTTAVSDYRSGGSVSGMAKVAGDSLKNDTQPAMLSPKEIVLPRSITMAPDAPEKAKAFVEAILRKQGHGNSKHHREFHKALREAILSRKS